MKQGDPSPLQTKTPLILPVIEEDKLYKRRIFVFTFAGAITLLITWLMAHLLIENYWSSLDSLILLIFIPLTALVSIGFCHAMIGFWIHLRGGDAYRITRILERKKREIPSAPTAIVMPIFNETVSEVFAAIAQLHQALKEAHALEAFDLFILSDSTDINHWIEEEIAWAETCKKLNAFGKIFYRHRRKPRNQKSGNISDFCRRWGKRYRYMVVLDADSLMSAHSILDLVRLMEHDPNIGIIQTLPFLVRGQTFFARMLQFTVRLYGPIFAAGLNFWQQSEANYWGHNAILRLAPFIRYCNLPSLPGPEPLGGRILSHDYVEAALMKKAGYSVWLAYDLEGSYEQTPPTLIDYAKRDRRWCQGNLQHSWLVSARGFHLLSRLHLTLGILAYMAAPLWFIFIVLSILQTYSEIGFASHSNETIWTIQLTGTTVNVPQSLVLFTSVLSMLFLPKLFCLLWQLANFRRSRLFGGRLRLIASVFLETLLSMLLAPIHMFFISKFVLFALLGKNVTWAAQNRSQASGTSWSEALSAHGSQTLVGITVALIGLYYFPGLLLFLAPILAGLILSIPLSVFLSRTSIGKKLKCLGIFLTPEEIHPPKESVQAEALEAEIFESKDATDLSDKHSASSLFQKEFWVQAVVHPLIHSFHLLLIKNNRKTATQPPGEHLKTLCRKLLKEGPDSISKIDKQTILQHPVPLTWLHQTLWSTPNSLLAPFWQNALKACKENGRRSF